MSPEECSNVQLKLLVNELDRSGHFNILLSLYFYASLLVTVIVSYVWVVCPIIVNTTSQEHSRMN